MDKLRQRAYQDLLSMGLLHVKWDLACWAGRFSWLNPRRAYLQIRAANRASYRAYAFHNLAIQATLEFSGFQEHEFWQGIEKFQRAYPDDPYPYRSFFERRVRGDPISIVAPDSIRG
jgi:hypothetical protein